MNSLPTSISSRLKSSTKFCTSNIAVPPKTSVTDVELVKYEVIDKGTMDKIKSLIEGFIYEQHNLKQLNLVWNADNSINMPKLKKWFTNNNGSNLTKLVEGFRVTKQVNNTLYSNINKKMIVTIAYKGNSNTEVSSEEVKRVAVSYKELPIFVKPEIFSCHINDDYTAMLIVTELNYNQSGEKSAILGQYIRAALTYLTSPFNSAHDLVRLIIDKITYIRSTRSKNSKLIDDGSNEVRLINCIYGLPKKRIDDGFGPEVWNALAFAYIFDNRKDIKRLFDKGNKFNSDKFYKWLKMDTEGSRICDYLVIRDIENITLYKDKKTISFGEGYNTTIENTDSSFKVKLNNEQLQELKASEYFCKYLSSQSNISQPFGSSEEFNEWLITNIDSRLDIDKLREYSKNLKIECTDWKSIITFGKYFKIEFIKTEEMVKKYFLGNTSRDECCRAAYTKLAPNFYSSSYKDKDKVSSIEYLEMMANQLMVDLGYSKEKLTIESALSNKNDPLSKIFLGLSISVFRYKYKNTMNTEGPKNFFTECSKNDNVFSYLVPKVNFAKCDNVLTSKLITEIDEYLNSSEIMLDITSSWNIQTSWLRRYKDSFFDIKEPQDSDAEDFLNKYKNVLLQINKSSQLKVFKNTNIKYNLNPEDDTEWVILEKASGRMASKGEMRGYMFLVLVAEYFKAHPSSNLYEFLNAKSYPKIGDIIFSAFALNDCWRWVERLYHNTSLELEDKSYLCRICDYLTITKFILNILKNNTNFQDGKKHYLEYLSIIFEECPIASDSKKDWDKEVSDWESFIIKECFPANNKFDVINFFDNSENRKYIFKTLNPEQHRNLIYKMHKECKKDSSLKEYIKDYLYIESKNKDELSENSLRLDFDYNSSAKRVKSDTQTNYITISDDDLEQIDPVSWFITNLLPQPLEKDDYSYTKYGDVASKPECYDKILLIFRKAIRLAYLNNYAENGFQYNAARISILVNHVINSCKAYKNVALRVEEYVNAFLNLTLYNVHKDRDPIKGIDKTDPLKRIFKYCCNAMNQSKVERKKTIEAIFICMNKCINKYLEVEHKTSSIGEGASVDEGLDVLLEGGVFSQILEEDSLFSHAKMSKGAYFVLAILFTCDRGIPAINPPLFKFQVAAFTKWLSEHNCDKYFEVDDDLTFLEENIEIIQISRVKYQIKIDLTNGAIWDKVINYMDTLELYIVLLDDLIISELHKYGTPKTNFERHEMVHRIMKVSLGQEKTVPYFEKYTSKFDSPIFTYCENMLSDDDDVRKTLYNTIFTRIENKHLIISTKPQPVDYEYEVKIMD